MVSRKRTREEAEDHAEDDGTEQPGLLQQLRSSWEFANLMQFIFLFGKAVKIDDNFDIEDLETECLKPTPSEKLLDIGLGLLRFVSSFRGITLENFEGYARRQYLAKSHSRNPFGDAEEPKKFNDLDVLERIRVLQQLATWTFWNPDRVREKMPEQKEIDQTQWRIEELGYDREDRLYYLLDDNRLYRRADPPIPPPMPAKPKANSKKARAAARAAKKRKLSGQLDANGMEDTEHNRDEARGNEAIQDHSKGCKWDCIAISLAEYTAFVDKLRKTKDPNEQILRDRLVEHVIPIIERAEEAQQKKIQRREKELLNLQKLANAKRSSRIADKAERERRLMDEAEETRKQEAEQLIALKEEEKRRKIEEERQYRLMTREQRIKEREQRRQQQQEELSRLANEAKAIENGEVRMSERQVKAEMERKKKHIDAIKTEDQWVFDCSGCGTHGANLDDGSHSVACEKCNVWQHSKCLGISQAEAEKDDFHFICADCKRKMEEAKLPKIPPLKFRIQVPSSPTSTTQPAVLANGDNAAKPPDIPSASPPVRKAERGRTLTYARSNPPDMIPHAGAPVSASPAKASPMGIQGGLLPPIQLHRPESLSSMPNGSHRVPAGQSQSAFFAPTHQSSNLGSYRSSPPSRSVPGHHPPQPVQPPVFIHYQPPGPLPSASFGSQRPTSSHSDRSILLSPIQNRPSMSPTQGNRDVSHIAGFPSSTLSNCADKQPGTPGQRVAAQKNPASPRLITPTHPELHSFSSVSSGRHHYAYTPPQQQYPVLGPPPTSGLSPTKHSPPQPSGIAAVGSTVVLPPIQKLEPSPKLAGRLAADAPFPTPVKSIAPEADDHRQNQRQGESNNKIWRSPSASTETLPAHPPKSANQQFSPSLYASQPRQSHAQ